MGKNVQIGKLSESLQSELALYSKEIADGVKKAVDDISEEMLRNIKADAPKRTGKYQKAMKVKTMYESASEKRNRWYVDGKRYRLSHLLENPHATKNGGKSLAFPHIRKNEEKAKADFNKRVEEVIKNAGN